MLSIGVVTLLPDMFKALTFGVTGRAVDKGLVTIDCFNPRQWAKGPYRQVDDKPYGGGPGMVMMYEPLHQAIKHAKQVMPAACKTIYLSPQGQSIQQSRLNTLAKTKQPLLFLAGRYEGIDERLLMRDVDEEWSLGDFVLSGGELAAMVFIDALVRLLPGSLGSLGSAEQDSFMNGLLDYPHYTRPVEVDGMRVPEVLIGGHHLEIERFRRKQALGKTWLKRPDLLSQFAFSSLDEELLNEFKHEHGNS